MKLIAHDLNTELYQEITPTENLDLFAIRPHLFKSLNPAGSLKIEIRDGNNYKISESNILSISSISAANYFHGYVKFDINTTLAAGVPYRIVLVPSGYSASGSDYVSWIAATYELKKVESTYSPNEDFHSPLDLEIWIKRKV